MNSQRERLGSPNRKSGKTPIVVLTGPTAIGKTQLALEASKHISLEVISADSRQIYRGMDIGTGKPTKEQQRSAPHHLIDVMDPGEVFSAADFASEALRIIEEVRRRGVVPLIVGGTFLYLKALLQGFFDAPGRSEPVRARLLEMAERSGGESLHRRLLELDPEAASTIHPNDHVRLVRALEVIETTGKTVSELKLQQARLDEPPVEAALLALSADRQTINKAIDERVERMFANGFVEEVMGLLEAGYSPSLNSFSSLGYRQVADYISGSSSLDDAKEATKVQTRRFAKKQLLWMAQDWGFEFLRADETKPNLSRVIELCRWAAIG
ncbi:MAG: tRNA (adenosine(37)-N6)-dimethylallyltransferase MiaA [Candidatus Coatesbacteria bacterium]|nr:tRNA (adenosine(37)-N6)-dimethylallyltransferase MiaA [Candidatus Coatesbacteria bacterium]